MNFKKLLAAVAAAAVTASSVSVNAFPTLLPLKEYRVEAHIYGYTEDQLKEFPIKTLLSELRYSEDVTVEIRKQSEEYSANAEAPVEMAESAAATAESTITTAWTMVLK